jgi:hypothetical protein
MAKERGPSCPVPGDAWRVATVVLSTVARKKMRREKTFLPLEGMRNYGSSHRALLFSSVTTDSHARSMSSPTSGPRMMLAPQISDRGWNVFQVRLIF